MDSLNIIALIIIVGGGGWLNWDDLKQAWRRFKWRIPHTFHKYKHNYKWHIILFWRKCKPYIKKSWNWCKRFQVYIKKNPAIGILIVAWACIVVALGFFAHDVGFLYNELSKQILEGGKDADEYRGIAIRYFGIIAGVGTIIGYIMVTARNIIANKQNKISEQQRITESMVQAITQIGAFNDDKPNIEVRLGGLYSLQRIMQNSPEDEQTILKILYAYVRENTRRDKTEQPRQKIYEGKEKFQSPEDIQAVLGIISQFNKDKKQEGASVFLANHENRLSFTHVDFSYYSFMHMDFSNAILYGANLSGADLTFTNLSEASLQGVNLTGAKLAYTNLSGATLTAANLTNAKFGSVDLSTVKNLTQEQINKAKSDPYTSLPEGLSYPEHWPRDKDYEREF